MFQQGKNLAQVSAVKSLAGAGDEDVIEVHEHEGQAAQKRVHEALKRHARVPQAKKRAHKLKQTKRRNTSRFGDVSGSNWDLEVALPKVQFA
jgi:hypothetical protein